MIGQRKCAGSPLEVGEVPVTPFPAKCLKPAVEECVTIKHGLAHFVSPRAATLVSGSIGDYDDASRHDYDDASRHDYDDASRHDIGLTCQILDDPTDLCEPCLIAKIRRSSMEAVGHGHGKCVS
jgi:hypothetical protein